MVLTLIKEYRRHMIERVITDNTLPKRMSTVLGMIVLTSLLITAVVINLFMNELNRADDAALASSFRYTADLMAKKFRRIPCSGCQASWIIPVRNTSGLKASWTTSSASGNPPRRAVPKATIPTISFISPTARSPS